MKTLFSYDRKEGTVRFSTEIEKTWKSFVERADKARAALNCPPKKDGKFLKDIPFDKLRAFDPTLDEDMRWFKVVKYASGVAVRYEKKLEISSRTKLERDLEKAINCSSTKAAWAAIEKIEEQLDSAEAQNEEEELDELY
jgi:hypothetical protein